MTTIHTYTWIFKIKSPGFPLIIIIILLEICVFIHILKYRPLTWYYIYFYRSVYHRQIQYLTIRDVLLVDGVKMCLVSELEFHIYNFYCYGAGQAGRKAGRVGGKEEEQHRSGPPGYTLVAYLARPDIYGA